MQPSTDIGPLLIGLARGAIARHLGLLTAYVSSPDGRLAHNGASFVTLKHGGELRGCIGSTRPQRPLGEDVARNAVAAATRDPRFPPLDRSEFDDVKIEVSILSEPELLDGIGEEEVLSRLRPGKDGLIVFSGCRSATFLPQVWEQLPEPAAFIAALKRKAGIPPESPSLMFATYTVKKWHE